MKEMKTHENRVELLLTAISAVITLVGGTGLSILLGGLVQGFFALTGFGLVLALIIAWRRPFSLELHFRGPFPEIELVRPPRAGRGKRRESIAD
jgi:hypothetical protein